MPTNEIEKQYSELKKKFKLPEFKEIDNEFELSDLEETNFLLRAIMRRISEKLDFYSTVLEEVLQPDASNLYAMHETRYFDDEEKNSMYDLYKRLMSCSRHSIEISIEHNEKDEADFINNFFEEWKPTKADLLKFIKKMRVSWKTEANIKEDVGYLG